MFQRGVLKFKVSYTKKAVILMGHGSPVKEANDTLRKVAQRVYERGGFGMVQPAFLQFEKPDLEGAVEAVVARGFRDVVVVPYFLYTGAHVSKDIPGRLEHVKKRYPSLSFVLAENIGFHDKMIEIVMERIGNALGLASGRVSPARYEPHPIEKESMSIIEKEVDLSGLKPVERSVIKRVIHATADPEFRDIVHFSPGATGAGISAIRTGKPIVVDVRMVEAGILKRALLHYGGRVYCFSGDGDVEATARAEGTTRSAVCMRKAVGFMEGGIVCIGNAPTALVELLRLVREGRAEPALIIGVPVGFVGAEGVKADLSLLGCEFITTRGRKGGSTVAVSIINALIIEALKGDISKGRTASEEKGLPYAHT